MPPPSPQCGGSGEILINLVVMTLDMVMIVFSEVDGGDIVMIVMLIEVIV